MHPATSPDEQALNAIDIDLRCSLVLTRALMSAFAAISAQARHALDAALAEELMIVACESSKTSAAVQGFVNEARAQLTQASSVENRLARDLESAIVECAAQLPEPMHVVGRSLTSRG